jgi:hypothetical protein
VVKFGSRGSKDETDVIWILGLISANIVMGNAFYILGKDISYYNNSMFASVLEAGWS